MYSVIIMSRTPYAIDIGDVRYVDDNVLENIQIQASQGNPVIICEDFDELDIFGIDKDSVVIIED